jgi:hypothetical protein
VSKEYDYPPLAAQAPFSAPSDEGRRRPGRQRQRRPPSHAPRAGCGLWRSAQPVGQDPGTPQQLRDAVAARWRGKPDEAHAALFGFVREELRDPAAGPNGLVLGTVFTREALDEGVEHAAAQAVTGEGAFLDFLKTRLQAKDAVHVGCAGGAAGACGAVGMARCAGLDRQMCWQMGGPTHLKPLKHRAQSHRQVQIRLGLIR